MNTPKPLTNETELKLRGLLIQLAGATLSEGTKPPAEMNMKIVLDKYEAAIMALIAPYGREARMEEHKLFEEWLYSPDIGVGTIHDWSKKRIKALKKENRND